MNRRNYLKTTTLAGTALACALRPESVYGFKGTNDGKLEGSLQTLNMWGEKPESVIKLYTAIYNALATNPEASFATVAGDETVRALCSEHGITHFGGPMLGCIANDGAKIWMRTTRPAKVEVKARVNGKEKTFGPVHSTIESDLTAIVAVTGLEPASLGGRSGPAACSDKWTTQLYGLSNKFAFGEFTFDLSKADPTVTYRLIEATGGNLYELTLKRSQLTPS